MKLLIVLLAAVAAASAANKNLLTLKDYHEKNVEPFIIKGSTAEKGQFPHQVGVHMHTDDGEHFCGGSLISDEWVLTAAHCVDGVNSWTLKFGAWEINAANEDGRVIMDTDVGFHHEDYNDWLNNDIALIRLPEKIRFTDKIRAVRLPTRQEAANSLVNETLTVSGWGKLSDGSTRISPYLQFVQLRAISNAECRGIYGQTIIDGSICCRGNPDHSPCNGDSGGPLIKTNADGSIMHVGVVSFVHDRGCASGNPSGYVRTGEYLDWISEKTGITIN